MISDCGAALPDRRRVHPDLERSRDVILCLMVLPFLATELCWLVLRDREPDTRLNAYLVCTAAILTLGSWLVGIAYERVFEGQHGGIGDHRASNMIAATAFQVATGTLTLLCVRWGSWAFGRSREKTLMAVFLYLMALPLAFLSFLFMFGANNW
jgi:hypothetical protein